MESPKISVVIPVFNDPEGLRTTLDSLVDQDFEKDRYEILPVDNNSTDNTGRVIEYFEEKYPEQVRGVEEKQIQSSYAARNTGVKNSKGNIIVFTDADMWWDEDVLSIVEEEFSNSSVDYLGAEIEVVRNNDNIASLLGMTDFGGEDECLEEFSHVPTAFLAIKKRVFDEVGGFDERMTTGADRLFGKKVSESGFNQGFSHRINVYHPVRSDWRSLLARSAKHGRSIYQTEKYNPGYADKKRKHPLSYRNFIPTLPWRLKNLDLGKENLSIKEFTGVYFLYWIDKLYFTKGYVSAILKDKVLPNA